MITNQHIIKLLHYVSLHVVSQSRAGHLERLDFCPLSHEYSFNFKFSLSFKSRCVKLINLVKFPSAENCPDYHAG